MYGLITSYISLYVWQCTWFEHTLPKQIVYFSNVSCSVCCSLWDKLPSTFGSFKLKKSSRYRDDLTIKELDETWPNEAVRDARIRDSDAEGWPLVIFSHGSGAYRASYIFFTEFLASQGFVVMACDHPGSARYTQVNGKIIKPGGPRSERPQMEADRPKDVMFLLDAMTKLASGQDWGCATAGLCLWHSEVEDQHPKK